MEKHFESEKSLKNNLFGKTDYFVRNWAINEGTGIGTEFQTKFTGMLEFIMDTNLLDEYAEYQRIAIR